MINILRLLKNCPLFSSLDEETLRKLLRKSHKVTLFTNQVLYKQEEPTTGIYFLIRGEISLYLTEDNQTRFVSSIHPGETLGEISALSGEPRGLSAKAAKRSIVLLIPGKYFREFCQQHPIAALKTLHLLVNRSHQIISLFGQKKLIAKGVMIIPANASVNLSKFYQQLIDHTKDLENIAVLSDYDLDFHRRYSNLSEIAQLVDNLEKKHDIILYFVKSAKTPLAHIGFERNSKIYLTAHSDSEPDIHPIIKEKIRTHQLAAHPHSLILLHLNKKKILMTPIMKWLNLMPFDLHHEIKLYEKQDRQRLFRFMKGQAVGIVLGGGGLRSWAHLGALQAIIEAGIPIDMIGGTSAGAVVAAHYVLHGTNPETYTGLRELSEIARKIVSFKNLTWPTLSLFNTNEYVRKQIELFDHICIEDMKLPCFFLSCNLSKNTEVVYRKGKLWEAITSSTAVPAIFPPVNVEEDLLVDGGILNNLPVDIMKRFIGPNGKVIAIELTRYNQDLNHYHYPPCLTTWDAWMSKLGFGKKKYKLPNILDIFLNSLLAGASFKQEINGHQADVLIKPNLASFGLMNVSRQQEDQLINLGRESTFNALTSISNSKLFPTYKNS